MVLYTSGNRVPPLIHPFWSL